MATKVKLIADGVITPDQITLTTASTGTNTTAPATTAFVQQEISALVDSSPEALNTLNELAAALGDDANFSTTVTNSIATKAPLASPTFTGDATFDTATLVIDSTNNRVGIGTSSPDTQLTLYKASTNADVNYAKMRMDSWGGSTGKLKSIVWDDAGSNVAGIGAEYDGAKTNIHFHSQYNGSFKGTSDRTMSIMGNGNVGIGTNSPNAALDVKRDTNTPNNLDSLGFDVAALIGNAGSNPGNHYTSGLRIYQGSGTVGSGLGIMHLGADNGTATSDNDYTAQIIAPSGMTGGIKLSAFDSAGTIRFLTGGNNERMKINSNGNVEVAEELILDSVGQSEWGMVKLDSQQLSGTYSQVEISISPSYSGYSVYKMIINRFRLAADGELWCNYMYGTTKKGGWFGGYSRAGEGNSTGQEGYSNQPQCEIVGTNTTATQNNSYPFVGEFTFYPLEAGNRGKIVWRGLGRLSSGFSQSIFGAALTVNTNAPDKIVFYSNQNITNFDYVLYGIKV